MASSYRIYIDQDEPESSNTKYKFGDDITTIKEIGGKKPLVAYDYVSLNKTDFCFNYPNLNYKDYTSYFEIFKSISSKSIDELIDSQNYGLHFHQIDLNKKRDLLEKIKSSLKIKGSVNANKLPIIGQFALYTDNKIDSKSKAPRVIFMMHQAVFYVLFMDVYHKTYSRN